MSEYVVVDNHFDPVAEVYRLTIGVEQEHDVPVFDEQGQPVFETEPLRGDDGEPTLDADGNEVHVPTVQRTERGLVLVPTEDFVFSALDDRWEGKTPEETIREQKRLVGAALRKREEAADAGRDVEQMPGVGDKI